MYTFYFVCFLLLKKPRLILNNATIKGTVVRQTGFLIYFSHSKPFSSISGKVHKILAIRTIHELHRLSDEIALLIN